MISTLKNSPSEQIIPDNFTYSTLIKGIRSEEQISDLNKAFYLFEILRN